MWLTNLFGKVKNINSDLANYREVKARKETCDLCPNQNADFKYLFFFKKKGVKQCNICKCAINDKVIWDEEQCPMNKW